MRITITGPRSVGKSTVSKLLAKKLKIPYFGSDDLMNNALGPYGGLDKVIKSGSIHLVMQEAVPQINKVLKHRKFVYDLAGGAVSSQSWQELSMEINNLLQKKSIIIGLLPYKNKQKSIEFLFKRERARKHFKTTNKKELRKKVEKDYQKLLNVLPKISRKIVYVENKNPNKIVSEILLVIR